MDVIGLCCFSMQTPQIGTMVTLLAGLAHQIHSVWLKYLNKFRKGVNQHLFPQMCDTYHYTIHLPPEIIIVMRIAASTHCKHVPVYVALQRPQWQHC